jgi:hypothetical protein
MRAADEEEGHSYKVAMAAEEDFAGLEKVWDAQEGAGVAVRRASGF